MSRDLHEYDRGNNACCQKKCRLRPQLEKAEQKEKDNRHASQVREDLERGRYNCDQSEKDYSNRCYGCQQDAVCHGLIAE